MKSYHIGLLCIIAVVCVLVTAGCTGRDYEQKTDIVVVKLTPDGNVSWSKVLDSGDNRDKATCIFEGKDGSIYIGGEGLRGYPWLIKLSQKGEWLWNITFTFNVYGDWVNAINETQDNTVVAAASAGTIWRFDSSGNRLGEGYSTGIDMPSIFSIPDGGFIVVGRNSTRFDRNGNVLNTSTPAVSFSGSPGALQNNITPRISGNLSSNESSVESQILVNASSVVTRTRDGGYFTSGFGKEGHYTVWIPGRVPESVGMAVKLNPDGTIAWEKHLSKIRLSEISKVIETSDGGFVVVGEYDRAFDTVFDQMFG